jgi:hypothetical protein
VPALLQCLHDQAISGAVSWSFEGAWKAELGWAGGFTGYGHRKTAQEIVDWMIVTGAREENLTFVQPGDLYVLQVLHDAEINGSVTWWKPSEGFTATVADEEPRHFPDWAATEAWLLSRLPGYV